MISSSTLASSSPSASERTVAAEGRRPEVPIWRSLVILAIGLIVWVFFWTKPQASLPAKAGVVMHLPGYVDVGTGFVGTTAEVTLPELQILPKDTEFSRKNYTDFPGPDQIFCGIVLSGATQQSIHRPEVCLVAQGWGITNQEDIQVPMDSGHILTVRNLTIQKTIPLGNKTLTLRRYNMYWFVGENVTTTSNLTRVLLSSWDRIVHNRAHRWAYVTVASLINSDPKPGELDAAGTKKLMIDFIRKIVPTFQLNEMTSSSS